MKKYWQEQSDIVRFFAAFLLYFLPLQMVLTYLSVNRLFLPSLEYILASGAGHVYEMFSTQWRLVDNVLIHMNDGSFVVVDALCTGLALIVTLSAAILAFPAPLKRRLLAAFMAIFLLQVCNIIRIAHLFHLIQGDREVFDLFHLYVWQCCNMVVAIVLFYNMVRWLKKPQTG